MSDTERDTIRDHITLCRARTLATVVALALVVVAFIGFGIVLYMQGHYQGQLEGQIKDLHDLLKPSSR